MAIRLPESITISDHDEHEPCRYCGDKTAADPDDMDGWAAHLTMWHGYRVTSDRHRMENRPRTIELSLVGWSARAEFRPNQRVTVNDKAPREYSGRRGTVTGWHSQTSQYAVAFDQEPILGVLMSTWLEPWVKS